MSTVFDVSVPPDRVVAVLAEPRNLMSANHEGPVLDRSPGPIATGSWLIIGFSQLRMRVDYIEFEPPSRIAVAVVMSGRGSGGMTVTHEFRLSELDGGRATRVEATSDGSGGLIRWQPIVRFAQKRAWQRLRRRIEAVG